METVLRGTSTTVRIGAPLPTVIVGERINPTGRKHLREALERGDYSFAGPDAKAQADAGAQVIDVNVGAPDVDEPQAIRAVIAEVAAAVPLPICIDSSNAKALEAALDVVPGRPLVNSTTGEERVMDAVLPLIKGRNAAVIALCMDESGIPKDVQGRLKIAGKILDRASKLGIPPADILIDTLVMSVGSDAEAARITLETTRAVRDTFGCNVVVGASNVSHGLPNRELINGTFLAMGVLVGFTAVIADPLVPGVRDAIAAADLLSGKDEWAVRYLKHHRSKGTSGR